RTRGTGRVGPEERAARRGAAGPGRARPAPTLGRGTRAAQRLARARRARLAPRPAAAPDDPRRARARRGDLREHAAARRGGAPSRELALRLCYGRAAQLDFAEAACGVDGRTGVEALVVGLLDQHHVLERVHVVAALPLP